MAPSGKLSQKEYLKKYLNNKKKKKRNRQGSRRENVRLIDDDESNQIDDNPFEDFEDGEDAPAIAGYYDERPTEVKLLENYRNQNRWQPLPGVDRENDNGTKRSERDGHHSPTSNRRERYVEGSHARKRKHPSSHQMSPPRSKHRQELSPPARRTPPPRMERRIEERGYSPSRRGDRVKLEDPRLFSDPGQRFRDSDHSPRRANMSRHNGGADGDRHRQEEPIYEDRYARGRPRQRSPGSGSPGYRNQGMDDEFRGPARRGDPRLSPFDDRDRFERPLPVPRRNERSSDRRYADEGRRDLLAEDHRMQPSKSQRNRRHSDVELPPPPPSKHRASNRGDDHLSPKMGGHRHNASPLRNDRRRSPLSPLMRGDRRLTPLRSDRRLSPLRNDRRHSPSPRANVDDSWRRSFSPAPSRRFHSPGPPPDSRRPERRDEKSPTRESRSRNERQASPPRVRKDGRRVDAEVSPPARRRNDRSREDRHPRDRRRDEAQVLQDIRDVSIDPQIVQETTRAARDLRETLREPRHHRDRDAGEHRREPREVKEPPVRTIEWKEKSTAVSRCVPAKRAAVDSPSPARPESPRHRAAALPSPRKRKQKPATAKKAADEDRRRQHESASVSPPPPPPSKGRVSRHEAPQFQSPPSSPKHRVSRHEPRPSTPPRYRDESKQRGVHARHKRVSAERDPRGRRTSDDPNEAAAKDGRREKQRPGDSAPAKKAKKRDREDGEHKKSEKSSRHKDENYGLVSTKKSSSKPEDKLSDEQAGKNAVTIYRDAKTGRKRDLQSEKLEKIEKRRREDEKKEQYCEWGRGLKQVEEEKKRRTDEQHEMSKPLARYADDDDLNNDQREKIASLDPMFAYMQRKKQKKEAKEGKVTRPRYKGSWPPNRFSIPPGHKWDGVDRSNGFESRYFAKQSDKKAMEEEAYKWCSEDM